MKRTPLRTCVGCMEKRSKVELARLVLTDAGTIKIDSTGKAHGRGAYLCKGEKEVTLKESCLNLAIQKKAFKRVFKMEISDGTVKDLLIEKK